MAGISSWEAVVLLLVVLLVVGPEKLPDIAKQVGGWLRTAREFLDVAKERVENEIGTDLASLDPRQYDPRTLLDSPAAPRMHTRSRQLKPEATPFDDEAT